MIQRFYVHHYRCLENFELPLAGRTSTLLIGKNGAGKSTIGDALWVLQSAARGVNRVGQLVRARDFTRGRTDSPVRFDLDVVLENSSYKYVLVLEFPIGFKEPRVLEEKLVRDGQVVYERSLAQVILGPDKGQARFLVDWHLVALPIVQEHDERDPIFIFKRWLRRMLLLAPVPSFMSGESTGGTLEPDREVRNLGEWFTGLLAATPASYTKIIDSLRELLPDLEDIQNPITGSDRRNLSVQFQSEGGGFPLTFSQLSAGEKCFLLGALVLASAASKPPPFCFWDEPDTHLSISEVGYFVRSLRRAFSSSGQLVVATHDPEAIRVFSDENTFLLSRSSHLEPPRLALLEAIKRDGGDLIDTLRRGDLDP